MEKINTILSSTIQLHILWVIFIGCLYVIIHQYRHKPMNRILDIYFNYIPVLTHEFGHIIFNKLSGGKARDFVIVASPKERMHTSQQGYAITQSKGRLGQIITTFGGYVMPPAMLYLGFLAIQWQYPSLFIMLYLFIFCYFVVLTSRKLLPIIIVLVLGTILYFLITSDNQLIMMNLIALCYHFILGVLLGEVLQSSWTIFKLTFSKQVTEWDGSALKELTNIPTLFFSLLWIIINLFTLYNLANIFI
ncbi:M50 family metallopeptidase [Staphylococcus kloosii]|uniref:M50 family metallopeptidase n=1 Tax=Staphylococcus kloosii TaxID=29384 RepID=UPI0028A4B0BC|nr:M50 family metallopeptidase [Staphylococcus kloosii]MDT3959110.1 M50 family metallopeptidase [Staphylococcus kloosii]